MTIPMFINAIVEADVSAVVPAVGVLAILLIPFVGCTMALDLFLGARGRRRD